MLGIIPVIILIGTRFGKFVKRVQGEIQDALADATQAADEAISSIRTVRSFSREDTEIGERQPMSPLSPMSHGVGASAGSQMAWPVQ
jgi:ABC-type multidrug transport system fused ATPase/permease subunit